MTHRLLRIVFGTGLVFLLLHACSSEQTKNIPPATGATGDMYIIMDSLQWRGPLGDVLDSLFRQEMQGLPRPEPIFKVRWIDPRKLNPILKQRRNLLYAITFDQRGEGAALLQAMFSNKAVAELERDTSHYIKTTSDVYALRQEVMYLFAMREADLIRKVKQNAPRIVQHFDKRERDRMTEGFTVHAQKGISDFLQKQMGCDLKIPFGYKLVMNTRDFLWMRQINPKDDRDIFIYKTPYTSVAQFEEQNLIALRDSVCHQFLFEDPDKPDTYLLTETTVPFIPVRFRTLSHHGLYAKEMRGLWRTHNYSMGGPFVALALADAARGTLYYVEGFVYGPGKDLRELIREVETIVYTFQPAPSGDTGT